MGISDPQTLDSSLRAMGFDQVAYLNPENLTERFSHQRKDGLGIPGYFGLMKAKDGS